jgi:anti-sigma B factor antagonist
MSEASQRLSQRYGLQVQQGDAGEIRLLVSGEVDLETAPLLLDSVLGAGSAGEPGHRVVIDLQDVSFIDSSGLAALVEAHHRTTAQEQALYLANVNERIHRLISVTALDRVIPIEEPAAPEPQAL